MNFGHVVHFQNVGTLRQAMYNKQLQFDGVNCHTLGSKKPASSLRS